MADIADSMKPGERYFTNNLQKKRNLVNHLRNNNHKPHEERNFSENESENGWYVWYE